MRSINKKAMAMNTLVAITITIISLVLIAYTVTKFSTDADEKESEALCRNSVAFRTASTINILDSEYPLSPVLCKTIDLKVEKKEKEEVKEELAKKMARCWWMFNEARQDDLLDRGVSVERLLGFGENDNNCFLCYTLIFENGIEDGPISSQEMSDYILNTKYPKTGENYINYFQSYGGPGTFGIIDEISQDDAYGILFMSRDTTQAGLTLADALAAGGVVIGGISCIASVGITCAIAAAVGGTYLAAHAANVLAAKEEFYHIDRPISMIVLDKLSGIERSGCVMGSLEEE